MINGRWIGRRQHCDQAGSTIQLSKYAAHTSGRVWTICMGGCKAEHHWGQVAWLNYSASRAAPGRRGGATAIPGRLPFAFPDRKNPKSCVKGRRNLGVQGVIGHPFDFLIIKLLQNGDNGGLCPFAWQEFRVFKGVAMAGSCQTLNCFIL